jgi:excisionase family DNA binding protein
MLTPISMTVPNAVKATGLSRSRLYEELKKGTLTAKKAGRRTLISFADLKAFLDSLPDYQAEA